MPIKNNRNSRDDKSSKFNKSAKTERGSFNDNKQKAERPEGSNATKKKLFDGESNHPFKKTFNKSAERPDSKSYGDRKILKKETPNKANNFKKATGEKVFSDRKTFASGSEHKQFERKPFRIEGSRPERKPFKKEGSQSNRDSQGERPQGDRKPYGTKGSRPERKSFGNDGFQSNKQPFNERPNGDRKSSGTEGSPQQRKSFSKDGFQSNSKPYSERKPFSTEGSRPERKSFNSDRPQSFEKGGKSFDKKPFKSGTENAFRSYNREKSDRNDSSKVNLNDNFKPTNRVKKTEEGKEDGLIRLNRFIANAGICSRRKADELISAGVVSVNGIAITELGFKIDPAKDLVRYNGEALRREKMVYVLLNKPKDYITTTEDPQERKTVMSLVEKASKERIYPVGRLDRNTTGLLLMTNDGDLAEKLSHPRNNVTKIYQVELNRNVPQGDLNKIAFGLELEDGLIKPDQVSYVIGGSKNEIGIQIHSGKNRIVRRIFEHLNYEVVKLDRVVYSNLTKKDLPRGKWRYLEEKEIIQLKHLIR